MMTTSYICKIGNFVYTDFPVLGEIEHLRKDAAQKLMTLFRMIGLGTPRQINVAIDLREDDDRIERLLTRIGVVANVSEEISEENKREMEEIQEKIVANDGTIYTIKVSDIAAKVQGIHYNGPEKAIRELLAGQGYEVLPQTGSSVAKPKEKSERPEPTQETKKAEEPTTVFDVGSAQGTEKEEESTPVDRPEPEQESGPTPDPKRTIEETEPQTDPKITQLLKYAKECPLKVRKGESHIKVLGDREYLEALFKYFPRVSYELMAKYLFDGSVSPTRVSGLVRYAGVEKFNTRHPIGEAMDRIIYERASFVCWAGGDWKTYLADALKLARDREAKMSGKVRAGLTRSRAKDERIASMQNGEKPLAEDSTKITQPDPVQPPVQNETNEKTGESAAPAQAPIAEQSATIPGAQPIQHKEGSFSATIEVSTKYGRNEIEKLIVQIINEMPLVDLDSYLIYPDE
ncbi:hypothetical protein IKG06_04195 [Candidatus Saccharibacteria bacterium]|nr:hypothetical protein [Candidatus Saccharibacteria bacterium]